ncbi:hypothetical protein [Chryseobacterium indologenes]|uniref:Uncharacterized protein n=1 Tax=Chryseobacterium indologenes TaxID=253 RepID=A0A0N0ZVB4_CHRID|nr:hypothetical protein [Chryseobacterium indologenes]KPE51870.1 hypothetical protein AOB46_06490 [Chryseobacterium indologenes]
MERHHRKFNEIKELLQQQLGDKITVSEEHGNETLELTGSSFWLMADHSELTVGYGLNHTHFSDQYNNLEDGIAQVFDLLTHPIRTTEYIKGNTVFKTTVEIVFPNSQGVNIGTTSLLFYPFWKKTKIQISISEKVMEKKEIEEEVNRILNKK